MYEFKADLHCHTTCSDGSATPEMVIELAAAQGLSALAITDHDTIDAYPAALSLAKQAGIPMISGTEFSAAHNNISVHILAYSFSVDSPLIQAFCSQHQVRREKRTKEMLHLLAKHGMPISEEELYAKRGSKRGIGRPHLAQAMIEKGYVKDLHEAFKRFLGDGRPCYASGKPSTVEETLECIRQANGYAVLAHPHLNDHAGILKALLNMPFDGIECFYARFNRQQNQRWVDIADKKGWLALGGSDFHGASKPQSSLGCSWTPEATFRILEKRFLDNSRASF